MGTSSIERRAIAAIKRRRAAIPAIGEQDRSTEGRGRTALVTGASSGIGRSMAELLAAKGYDVVVVARREQRLKEVQADLEARFGVAVHPLPCDLTAADASATIAAELCHRLLPHMRERGWGRIINVTSVGGMFPGAPTMALYTAAKSFVHKLSEAIDGEYRGDGVHCTVSAPGATETEIFEVVGIVEYWDNNLLPQISMMRPETVARQAYAGCMAGRKVVVHGAANKVWAATLLHSPKAFRYRLVDFLGKMQPAS